MIVEATTLSIRSEASDFKHKTGARGGNQRFYKDGYYHTFYFGHDFAVKPTKLIVIVEIDGKPFEVWVDQYFRSNIGRLTSSRVDRICNTVPEVLTVEEMQSYSGKTYYRIFEDQIMDQWLTDVQAAA